MNRTISLMLAGILVLAVSGCGYWKDFTEWWRPTEMARATPEGLYNRGIEQYQEGRYKKAVESFQRLRELHPLHALAPMAELGIADSYFSDKSYVEAELTYRDFINMRPTNENVPYAMHQVGMSHFRQMDSIDRDQTDTVKALQAFERLIARFPDSKFSRLAEQNVLECRRHLAEHEFYVGDFYFKNGKYKAALGRFETIAQKYPGIGLDYKVSYFIEESRKRLMLQEAEEKARKQKEEQKARAREEKAAKAAPKTSAPTTQKPAETAPPAAAPATTTSAPSISTGAIPPAAALPATTTPPAAASTSGAVAPATGSQMQ